MLCRWVQAVHVQDERGNQFPDHIHQIPFLISIIDAMEGQHVMTCDIPGAFMQADMDELLHVKMEGELAELLIKVDSSYAKAVTYEWGKPVLYTELDKALYGSLQAALLFWKHLSNFLKIRVLRSIHMTCVL